MVLAFYLDPFFVPCRQRAGTALWGTETLSAARARALAFLCAGEEELELQLTRELGSFLRFADGGVAETPAARLHPTIWWQVHGDEWPTLQFVAVRLLSLPCSSAGSERAFKPLGSLLSRTRNRTLDARVDKQWRIYVNSRQLKRADVLPEYTRSATERYVVEIVKAGNPGPPAGAGGPAGGGAGPADVPGPAAVGAPPGEGAAEVDAGAVAAAADADLDFDADSSSSDGADSEMDEEAISELVDSLIVI